MSHTPHELPEAFPEHVETIAELKKKNAHFARLADEYHEVNRTIHRAETNIEPMDDFHIEDLRKQRLRLLDQIGPMLRTAKG